MCKKSRGIPCLWVSPKYPSLTGENPSGLVIPWIKGMAFPRALEWKILFSICSQWDLGDLELQLKQELKDPQECENFGKSGKKRQ